MTTIAAEKVIPHRSPMRMIDSLIEWNDESAVSTVIFNKEHMAVSEGFVTEPALVEAIAQTVAAMEGIRKVDNAKPDEGSEAQPGMLCGVTDFVVENKPKAEEPLKIKVHVQKRLGSMLLIDGIITSNNKLIATGSLKLSSDSGASLYLAQKSK